MKEKILGYSGIIKFDILYCPQAKFRKYNLVIDNNTIANFDTEEKARIFADGLDKGLDLGYSEGYKKNNLIGG